jgi:hypothetical protein
VTQQQQTPIIVQVIEQPADETTVADILIGSLGLTGVLLLTAIVLGAILGGILIGVKKVRARYDMEPVPDSEALRVTPNHVR